MPSAPSILIVDDEADLLSVLKVLLASRGYNVISAGDGEEALARLESGGIDIVLLDMCLPNLGGLGVLKEAHRLLPDLPIVVFTAFPNEHTGRQALALGARDYLIKPAQFADIERVLYEQLSARLGRAPELTRAAA